MAKADLITALKTRVAAGSKGELQAGALETLTLMLAGICPFCEAEVRDWTGRGGTMSAAVRAYYVAQGFDPGTGHLATCPRKELTLT